MKIALVGYGKMGKEIEKISLERGHEIVLIIDRDNHNNFTKENIQKADIVIEFSTPDTAYDNYIKCIEAQVPVVSGTTGWLDKREALEDYCKLNKSGFFYASNFSLGVNLFFELNKKLASMMNNFSDYDVEMKEIHHIHKLDAPSGTAITLAEGIIDNIENKKAWELDDASKSYNLKIVAKREGEVPGTHIIKYASDVDEIEIAHRAYSRKGFALGAVVAAEFMKGKSGVYGMKELLKNL